MEQFLNGTKINSTIKKCFNSSLAHLEKNKARTFSYINNLFY